MLSSLSPLQFSDLNKYKIPQSRNFSKTKPKLNSIKMKPFSFMNNKQTAQKKWLANKSGLEYWTKYENRGKIDNRKIWCISRVDLYVCVHQACTSLDNSSKWDKMGIKLSGRKNRKQHLSTFQLDVHHFRAQY